MHNQCKFNAKLINTFNATSISLDMHFHGGDCSKQNNLFNTPVVGLTAYTEQSVHDNCTAAGMDAVATKPIGIEQLQSVVAEMILKNCGEQQDKVKVKPSTSNSI